MPQRIRRHRTARRGLGLTVVLAFGLLWSAGAVARAQSDTVQVATEHPVWQVDRASKLSHGERLLPKTDRLPSVKVRCVP